MDEDDQTRQRRQHERAKRKTPQHKYSDMLQLLADRKIDEFAIDLDDLAAVSGSRTRVDSVCECARQGC